MQTTIKIAVSLPKEQFQLVEKQRRCLKVSRSAAVRAALSRWLQAFEEQKAIQQYLEGYRRHPESPAEIRAMERAALEALGHETW